MSVEPAESEQKAIELFREQGGILRTSEALRLGIHPRTLYALSDAGVLEQLSRGLYRLSEMPPLAHPDLVTVSFRVPQAVICLLSAQAIFWAYTYPTNVATENWTTIPANWDSLRRQWEYSHAAGAGFQIFAMSSLIVAALARARTRA